MEKEEINNRKLQEEAEKNAYQVQLEEPIQKVETFDNQTITTIERPKKKRSWIPILMIGLVIFLVFVLYYCINYKKYILIKSINTWKESAQKLTKKVNTIEQNWNQETIKLNGKMKIDAPLLLDNIGEDQESVKKVLDLISKLSIDMDLKVDQTNQASSVAFKGDLENQTLFDIVYTSQNNRQYLLLNNVLKRYIDLGPTEMIKESNTKEFGEYAEHTWKVLIKSVKKNIKSSYIKKSSEKIEIDGKNISTNKITLVLNEKNMSELVSNVVKDLKKDQKASEFITSLYPEFQDFEVTISEETEDILNYSVYVKKGTNTIVMVSIHDSEDELNHIIGKNDTFELIENQKLLAKAILNEEKNGFKITVKMPSISEQDMTITQKVEKENTIYQLDLDINEIKVNAIYETRIKDVSKDSYSLDTEFSVDMNYQDQKIMTLVLDMNAKVLNEAKIEEVKNAVAIDQLTEEEQQKLISYLEEIARLLDI